MSKTAANQIRDLALGAATDAAWAQWSMLSPMSAGAQTGRSWSIIDPEALLLLTVSLLPHEYRLGDLLMAFAREHSALISVQRASTLLSGYPITTQASFAEFARRLVLIGDKRWLKHSAQQKADMWPEVRPKSFGAIRLTEGPALVLRLRAGFGVGAKADVLACLLGMHDAAISLKVLAAATSYNERTIRRAVEAMVLAGLVHEIEGAPTLYYAQSRPWAEILASYRLTTATDASPAVPPWEHWSAVFEFLTHSIEWSDSIIRDEPSEYVIASGARTLLEKHRGRLKRARIAMGTSGGAKPAEYLNELSATLESVTAWIRAEE